MRAGRLLNLLLILQSGGRVTAGELAEKLEVSERTILRDLSSLGSAGVPVYSVRGRGGGFEVLDTFQQTVPGAAPGLNSTSGQLRRVRVRISPAALQMVVVRGVPDGWRRRPTFEPVSDRPDWIEGSFRFGSYDEAVSQLLAVGPEVEILRPEGLRSVMAEAGWRIASLHELA